MIKCKKCESANKWKNGFHNNKQRYKCRDCGCHYVEGDARTNDKIKAKKAMIVTIYSVGKVSITMLAKIFGSWPSLISRWLKEAAEEFMGNLITDDIKEIEFDEMWHFIGKKKENFGFSKHLTEPETRQLLGLPGKERRKISKGYTQNSNI